MISDIRIFDVKAGDIVKEKEKRLTLMIALIWRNI